MGPRCRGYRSGQCGRRCRGGPSLARGRDPLPRPWPHGRAQAALSPGASPPVCLCVFIPAPAWPSPHFCWPGASAPAHAPQSLSSPKQPREGVCEHLSQGRSLLCPQPLPGVKPRMVPAPPAPPSLSPPCSLCSSRRGLPAVPPTRQARSCPKALARAVAPPMTFQVAGSLLRPVLRSNAAFPRGLRWDMHRPSPHCPETLPAPRSWILSPSLLTTCVPMSGTGPGTRQVPRSLNSITQTLLCPFPHPLAIYLFI